MNARIDNFAERIIDRFVDFVAPIFEAAFVAFEAIDEWRGKTRENMSMIAVTT